MDIGNAQVVIDVRLDLAREKRLDGAVYAVQRICTPVLTMFAFCTFGSLEMAVRPRIPLNLPTLPYSNNAKVPSLETSHRSTIRLVWPAILAIPHRQSTTLELRIQVRHS